MQLINIILLALACITLACLVATKPKQLDQKWLLGLLLGSLGLLPGLIVMGFILSTAKDVLWLSHVAMSCAGASLAAIVSIRIAAPLIQHNGLGRARTAADDLTDRR